MLRLLKYFTEGLGWIQIALSPLIIGLVVGVLIYVNFPNRSGLVLGICASILGLIIGIVWATKIYKKTGTIQFLSRLSATPELDQKKENE